VRYVVTVAGQEVEVVVGPDGVRVDGTPVTAHLDGGADGAGMTLTLDGVQHRVRTRPGAVRGTSTVFVDGWTLAVDAADERQRAIRALSAATAGPVGPAPVVAPMPGLLVRVHVAPGDRVEAGQAVVVMEAMKMENELRAAGAGVVRTVEVRPGTAVEKGALLVTFDAPG
jgi:biotin carboxyl carrier protein